MADDTKAHEAHEEPTTGFVLFTDAQGRYNGRQYVDGLNVDLVQWDDNDNSSKYNDSGMHFARLWDIHRRLRKCKTYKEGSAALLWDVYVPPGTR